ncbi:MAG: VgrG-related protein [Dissulfurimicrobium sp.]|uniref:VgrG-related protein n=1 Tax=Dissulfurimicrobium sp. TaxID=2022436 RepID=UPI00404B257F
MIIKNPQFETLTMAGTVSQNSSFIPVNRSNTVNSFDAILHGLKENTPESYGGAEKIGKNFPGADVTSTLRSSNTSTPDSLSKARAALEQERFIAFLLMKLGFTQAGQGTTIDTPAAMTAGISNATLKTTAIHGNAADNISHSFNTNKTTLNKALPYPGSGDVGALSARFESGDNGPGAIGYDEIGGTSYGTYQISSRQGTFDRFVSFLDKAAPAYAARLRAAGNPDTGGRSGRVPQEWQMIAKEDPIGFSALQRQFIKETHYDLALQKIMQNTGLDLNRRSLALKEVLWSTSVQHGPDGAARIFKKAIEILKARGDVSDQAIINTVYDIRGRQFNSSPTQVQQAVNKRFLEEKVAALNILKDGVSA